MNFLFTAILASQFLLFTSGFFSGLNIFIVFVASILIIFMFTPQFLIVFKTRNTVGFNKPMFSLHMAVGFFYLVQCFLFFAANILKSDSNAGEIVKWLFLGLLNLYVLCLSCFMIYTKIQNQTAAEKLSMSELDYYRTHIEPLILEKK